MPSLSSIALYSLAALGTVAAPAEKRHYGKCISDAQADQVAAAYAELIVSYSDSLADAVLTENFTDYSESVNTLINSCPQGDAAKPIDLLAPTFTSREQFKTGQGQQPSINFERLNLWHSCDTVIVRWKTTNTAPIPNPKPVIGLISLELVKNQYGGEYPWLIDTVYSEFDAGAWLQNLVEAGICPDNAGLPAESASCSSSSAVSSSAVSSSTVVSPATPSSTWASSSTWAPASSSTWAESSATWAPSSTSSWAAETTSCDEDETSTAWATQTAYASTSTWA